MYVTQLFVVPINKKTLVTPRVLIPNCFILLLTQFENLLLQDLYNYTIVSKFG